MISALIIYLARREIEDKKDAVAVRKKRIRQAYSHRKIKRRTLALFTFFCNNISAKKLARR